MRIINNVDSSLRNHKYKSVLHDLYLMNLDKYNPNANKAELMNSTKMVSPVDWFRSQMRRPNCQY